MFRIFLTSWPRAFVLSLLLITHASASPLTAQEIIERSKQNGKGFKDLTQKVKMVLLDEDGDSKERVMLMQALTENDGDSFSLLTFTEPRREKGIALLTVAEQQEADKQYLYLPSTRRVKRILGGNRAASFRGSEFTFEDLSDQSTSDYRFELIGEEACGELSCYVLDRFPKTDESSYSKTRLWIDAQHFRPMKADFYDLDNRLLKTMTTQNYQLAENQYWYPEFIVMENHQTRKSTKMQSLQLELNTGLSARQFSELALRRN
ncbi:MAG: outer membrane lipoprotein-sorting protein [Pseudomonadales bacterium]|nr:outer membrane lipoprotein-sorting protein [Pseudomonadales bacterium]